MKYKVADFVQHLINAHPSYLYRAQKHAYDDLIHYEVRRLGIPPSLSRNNTLFKLPRNSTPLFADSDGLISGLKARQCAIWQYASWNVIRYKSIAPAHAVIIAEAGHIWGCDACRIGISNTSRWLMAAASFRWEYERHCFDWLRRPHVSANNMPMSKSAIIMMFSIFTRRSRYKLFAINSRMEGGLFMRDSRGMNVIEAKRNTGSLNNKSLYLCPINMPATLMKACASPIERYRTEIAI